MYLKKLKLVGFKSFLNPTEFIFDEGISSVVGPNGCGKSNISDSIRWVLGEQSAKSLRGNKMEDVIFNGTDSKQSLGMAEVSITFSNTERILPIEYNEVTVTRRVFRSGESEYYINKNLCRLKDVHELFYDTGIGTTAYSSLEQGKIDLILSSKPEDRKYVFEEAAGITKYKNKKKEALKKLEYTESNLIRLDDIIREVKRQLNSINRQAAKARKYKAHHEQLKDLDIKFSFRQQEKLSQELDGFNYKKTNLETREHSLLENIQEEEDNLTKFREKFNNIDNILSKAHTQQIEIEREINNSEHNSQYNIKKTEDIKETEKRWKESLKGIGQKISEYQKQLKDSEKDLQKTAAEKEKISGVLKNDEENTNQINEEISKQQKTLEEKKELVFNTVNQGIKIKNELTDFKIEEGHLKQLKGKIANEIKQLIAEQQQTKEKYTKEEKEISRKELSLDKHKNNLGKNTRQLVENKQNYQELEQEINKKQGILSAQNSQKELLLEVKNNYEGFYNGVRTLMLKRNEDKYLQNEIEGVVADIIEVEPKYELAIEVATGSRLQNIITKSDRVIEYAVDFLKNNKQGRATFLALNMIKAGKTAGFPEISKEKDVLGCALNFVKFDPKYKDILHYILGNSIIVKDIKTAIRIAKTKKINHNIVTLEGELVNPQGAVTGGSMRKSGRGLLGRETHIKKLQQEISALQKEISSKLNHKTNLLSTISKIEDSINQDLNNKHQTEIQIAALKNSLEKIKEQQLDIEKNQERREIEINDIQEKLQENLEKIKEINKNLQDNEAANNELKKLMASLEEAIKTKELKKAEEYNNLMQKKIDYNSICDKENSISLSYANLKSRYEEQLTIFEDRKIDIEKCQEQLRELGQTVAETKKNIKGFQTEKEKILAELEKTKKDKDKIYDEILKEENHLKSNRENLASLQKELRDAEVKINEIQLKADNIINKIMDEYGTDLKALAAQEEKIYDANTDWSEVENSILSLRKKLSEIGPVNLMAIEEHDELKERYEFLTKQQKDLINAKEDLLKAITRINITTKELLQETFCKVRENFREVFVKLFGGGQADLALTDEKNILEAGIDITAKPPGKKSQNILLLSGGEKSLVAVALLFAIYKVKPSPFCILDEIDAALDDSNIGRFVTLLADYKISSQFIVITHNKITISASSVLYGITMEEAGISKVVSVKFTKKEKQAEVVA